MSERNEEARQLLRKIIEHVAWRQVASINILGHCLSYIHDLETKRRVVTELDLGLRLVDDVRELYGQLGWSDIEAVVRDHVDGIPLPQSRIDFGLFYYLTGLAEETAMRSYMDCCVPEFAAIARSFVATVPGRPEPTRFLAFAADPTNRPQAQQYLNRWVAIALVSFGRAGTPGDRRAVELGLRSQTSHEMTRAFLQRLAPFLKRLELRVPTSQELGLELPADSLEIEA